MTVVDSRPQSPGRWREREERRSEIVYDQAPRSRPLPAQGSNAMDYLSSSSGSSSSYELIDISRSFPADRSGIKTFFTAPSERRRKLRRRRSSRLFKFNNSSSSSVNSDLAYGTGFLKRPKRRGVRSRKGKDIDREKYSEKHSDRYSDRERERVRHSDSGRHSGSERRGNTDAEILAVRAGFAALARKQNKLDLKAARGGKKPEAIGRENGQHGGIYSSEGSRGLGPSKIPYGSDTHDEDGWESVSDAESENSVDSRLAFGYDAQAGWWGGKEKYRPKSRKRTVVDPQQFGPENSLHGFLDEPVGFEDVSWNSSSDFGQHDYGRIRSIAISPNASFHGTQESLQQVSPIPIGGLSRLDGAGSEPLITSRPGPVPLQQPQPSTPLSQIIYKPIYSAHSEVSGILKRTPSSPSRGTSVAQAALVGVAGAGVVAAIASSRKDDRLDRRRDDDRDDESRVSSSKRREDRDDESRVSSSKRRDDYDDKSHVSSSKRREDRDDESRVSLKRRDNDRKESKDERRWDKHDSPDREVRKRREKDRKKDSGSRYSDEERRGKKREKRREEARDEGRGDRDKRREERRIEPSEVAVRPEIHYDDNRGSKSEAVIAPVSTVDRFMVQANNDAFPSPTTESMQGHERIDSGPKIVHVDREPDFNRKRSSSIKDQYQSLRDDYRDDYVGDYDRDRHQGKERDHALHEAERIYHEPDHPTAPIAAAVTIAAASAIAAESYRESRSEKRRSERRNRQPSEYDNRDYNSGEGDKVKQFDDVQAEADKHYRKIVMARKIASRVRSHSDFSDGSVVDKYEHREGEEQEKVLKTTTLPELELQKDKGPYDAPNADFKPDYEFDHPRKLHTFRLPSIDYNHPSSETGFLKRDLDAERPRPLLNLVRPTPTPTPQPEKQAARSESKDRNKEPIMVVSDVVIGPRGDVVPSPTTSTVSKAVTWGENETKHFDVESPSDHRDEYISSSDVRSLENSPEAPKSEYRTTPSKGWGARGVIAAGVIGAGVDATATSFSEISSGSKKSKTKEKERETSPPEEAYEYRGVIVEPDSPPSSRRRSSPPSPGPKPIMQLPHTPRNFDDDLEFAATVAAVLKNTGFDSDIVINDASFYRQELPPGSNETGPYRAPFAETVSDLSFTPPNVPASPGSRGVIPGKVATNLDERRSVSPAAEKDDFPIKLSKKDQKKRDKENAKRQSMEIATLSEPEPTPTLKEEEDSFYFTEPKLGKKEQKKREKDAKRQRSLAEDVTPIPEPTVGEEIVEEPESYYEKPKKKSKRDSTSYDDGVEVEITSPSASSVSQRVSAPVDVFEYLQKEDGEWNEPKKPKKSRQDSEHFDSPLASEISSERDRSSSRKKEKSRSQSDGWEWDPTTVPLPPSTASEISQDKEYEEPITSRKSSSRDSNIFNVRDRSVVSEAASRYDDEPRKKKKSSRSRMDDFDDSRSAAVSVASAPAGDEDSKKSKKKEKEKKSSSFFGLFSSKSEVAESSKNSKDDYEDVKKKKKSKRSTMPDPSSLSGSNNHSSRHRNDDDGAKSDSERRKSRSRSESGASKKDPFLDNAGIPGADVGIEQYISSSDERTRLKDDLYDPEITQRYFRPSIDPQYGDLLPLPPSHPPTPDIEPLDELPGLPDSRPGTPEAERRRERPRSAVRKGVHDIKPPSQSAVPLKFVMGNRSTPSSPGFARPSPLHSSPMPNPESPSSSRNKRPTSWGSGKEYYPLFLPESTRSGSNFRVNENEPETIFPELPPSTTPSRSSSHLETDDYDRTGDFGHFMSDSRDRFDESLSIDTALASGEPSAGLLDSQQSTPKASKSFPDFKETRKASIDHGDLAAKGLAVAAIAGTLGYLAHEVTKDNTKEELPALRQTTPPAIDPMTKERNSFLLKSSPISQDSVQFEDTPSRRKFSRATVDSLQNIEGGASGVPLKGDGKRALESLTGSTLVEHNPEADEFSFTKSKKDKKGKKDRLSKSFTQDDFLPPEPSIEPPPELLSQIEPEPEISMSKPKKDKKKGKKGKSNSSWETDKNEKPTQQSEEPFVEENQDAFVESLTLPNNVEMAGEIYTPLKKSKKSKSKDSWESALEPEPELLPESVQVSEDDNFQSATEEQSPDLSQEIVEEALTSEPVAEIIDPHFTTSKKAKKNKRKSNAALDPEPEEGLPVPVVEELLPKPSLQIEQDLSIPVETENFTSSKSKKDKKKDKGKSVSSWELEPVEEVPPPAIEESVPDLSHEITKEVLMPAVDESIDEFSFSKPKKDKKKGKKKGKSPESWEEPKLEPPEEPVILEPAQDLVEEPATIADDFALPETEKSKKKGKTADAWDPDPEPSPSQEAATDAERSTEQEKFDTAPRTEAFQELTVPSSKKGKKKNRKSQGWETGEVLTEPENLATRDGFQSSKATPIGATPFTETPDLPFVTANEENKQDKDYFSSSVIPAAVVAGAALVATHELTKDTGLDLEAKPSAPDGLTAGYKDEQLSLARQLQEEFGKKSKKDKKKRQSLPTTPDPEATRPRSIDGFTDPQTRARSLSTGPVADGDKPKNIYSEEQLELARQMKEDFAKGSKKSKKDKKKRNDSPGLSTWDDVPTDRPSADPVRQDAFMDNTTTTDALEDSVKRDGLEAGYQEDQLSLARQLQAEFGKKSKRDKKKDNRSSSQTPQYEELRSDYFEDTPQSMNEPRFEDPADEAILGDKDQGTTPDGLTAGYKEDQLELARQLKDGFASNSKKGKKDKKRDHAIADPYDFLETPTPFDTESCLPQQEIEGGTFTAPPEDDFGFTSKKPKKDKKGKKHATDDEPLSENPTSIGAGTLVADAETAEMPATEHDISSTSKKSKKDKKGKKRETSEPPSRELEEPISADNSLTQPESTGTPPATLEPEEAFAFIPKKPKKDKKGKKHDSFASTAADNGLSSEVPFTVPNQLLESTPPRTEPIEESGFAPVIADPDVESTLTTKASKKSKKGKKLARTNTDDFSSEIPSTESREPTQEGDQPIPQAETAEEVAPATMITEPGDEIVFTPKKSKKDKKNKKQDSLALPTADDVSSLESQEPIDTEVFQRHLQSQPVEEPSSVPVVAEEEFPSAKKSKKGQKRDSSRGFEDAQPLNVPAVEEEASRDIDDFQAEAQSTDAPIEEPAEEEWDSPGPKKLKKDKKQKKRGSLLPAFPLEDISSDIKDNELEASEAIENSFTPDDTSVTVEDEFAFTPSKKLRDEKKHQNVAFSLADDTPATPSEVESMLEATIASEELPAADSTGPSSEITEDFELPSKSSKKNKKKRGSLLRHSSTYDDLPDEPETTAQLDAIVKEDAASFPAEAQGEFAFSSKKPKKDKKRRGTRGFSNTPQVPDKPTGLEADPPTVPQDVFEQAPKIETSDPIDLPQYQPLEEAPAVVKHPDDTLTDDDAFADFGLSKKKRKDSSKPDPELVLGVSVPLDPLDSPANEVPGSLPTEGSLNKSSAEPGAPAGALDVEGTGVWDSFSPPTKESKKHKKKKGFSGILGGPSSVSTVDAVPETVDPALPADAPEEARDLALSDEVPQEPEQDEWSSFFAQPSKKDKKKRKSGISTPVESSISKPILPVQQPIVSKEIFEVPTQIDVLAQEGSAVEEWATLAKKFKKDKKSRESGLIIPEETAPEERVISEEPIEELSQIDVPARGEPAVEELTTPSRKSKKEKKKNGRSEIIIPEETIPEEHVISEEPVEELSQLDIPAREEPAVEELTTPSRKSKKEKKKNGRSEIIIPEETIPEEHVISEEPVEELSQLDIPAREEPAVEELATPSRKSKKEKNRKSEFINPVGVVSEESVISKELVEEPTKFDEAPPMNTPEAARELAEEIPEDEWSSSKKSKKDKKKSKSKSVPFESIPDGAKTFDDLIHDTESSTPLTSKEIAGEAAPIDEPVVEPVADERDSFTTSKKSKKEKKGKKKDTSGIAIPVESVSEEVKAVEDPNEKVSEDLAQEPVEFDEPLKKPVDNNLGSISTKKSKKDKKNRQSGISTLVESVPDEIKTIDDPIKVEGPVQELTDERDSFTPMKKSKNKKGKNHQSGVSTPIETTPKETKVIEEPVLDSPDPAIEEPIQKPADDEWAENKVVEEPVTEAAPVLDSPGPAIEELIQEPANDEWASATETRIAEEPVIETAPVLDSPDPAIEELIQKPADDEWAENKIVEEPVTEAAPVLDSPGPAIDEPIQEPTNDEWASATETKVVEEPITEAAPVLDSPDLVIEEPIQEPADDEWASTTENKIVEEPVTEKVPTLGALEPSQEHADDELNVSPASSKKSKKDKRSKHRKSGVPMSIEITPDIVGISEEPVIDTSPALDIPEPIKEELGESPANEWGSVTTSKISKKDRKGKNRNSGMSTQLENVPDEAKATEEPNIEMPPTLDTLELGQEPTDFERGPFSTKKSKGKKGKTRNSEASKPVEKAPEGESREVEESATVETPANIHEQSSYTQEEPIQDPVDDDWSSTSFPIKKSKKDKNRKSGLPTPLEATPETLASAKENTEQSNPPASKEITNEPAQEPVNDEWDSFSIPKSKKKKNRKSGISTPIDEIPEPSTSSHSINKDISTINLEESQTLLLEEAQAVVGDEWDSFLIKKPKEDKKSKFGMSISTDEVSDKNVKISETSVPPVKEDVQGFAENTPEVPESNTPVITQEVIEEPVIDEWTQPPSKKSEKDERKRQSGMSTPVEEQPSTISIMDSGPGFSDASREETNEPVKHEKSSPQEQLPLSDHATTTGEALIGSAALVGTAAIIADITSHEEPSTLTIVPETSEELFDGLATPSKKSKKGKKNRKLGLSTPADEVQGNDPVTEEPIKLLSESENKPGIVEQPSSTSDIAEPEILPEAPQEPAEEKGSTKKSKKDRKGKGKAKDVTEESSAIEQHVPTQNITEPVTEVETPSDITPVAPQENEWGSLSTKTSKNNKDQGKVRDITEEPLSVEQQIFVQDITKSITNFETPAAITLDTTPEEERDSVFAKKSNKDKKANPKDTAEEPQSIEKPLEVQDVEMQTPLGTSETPQEAEQEWDFSSTKISKKDEKGKSKSRDVVEEPLTVELSRDIPSTENVSGSVQVEELTPEMVTENTPQELVEEWGSLPKKKARKDKKGKGKPKDVVKDPFPVEQAYTIPLQEIQEPAQIKDTLSNSIEQDISQDPEEEFDSFSLSKSKKDNKGKGKSEDIMEEPLAVEQAQTPVEEIIEPTGFVDLSSKDVRQDVSQEPEEEFESFPFKKSKKGKKGKGKSKNLVEEPPTLERELASPSKEINEPANVEDYTPKDVVPELSKEAEEEVKPYFPKKDKKKRKSGISTPVEKSSFVAEPEIQMTEKDTSTPTLAEPESIETPVPETSVEKIEETSQEPPTDHFAFTSKESKKEMRQSHTDSMSETKELALSGSANPVEASTLATEPTNEENSAENEKNLRLDLVATPAMAETTKIYDLEPFGDGPSKKSSKDKRKRQATVDPNTIGDAAINRVPLTSWVDEVEEAEVERDLPVIDEIANDESLSHIASTTESTPMDDFVRPAKKAKKGSKRNSVGKADLSRSPIGVGHSVANSDISKDDSKAQVIATAGAIVAGAELLSGSRKKPSVSPKLVEPEIKLSKKEKRKMSIDKRTPTNDIFDDDALWEGADPKEFQESKEVEDDAGEGFWSAPQDVPQATASPVQMEPEPSIPLDIARSEMEAGRPLSPPDDMEFARTIRQDTIITSEYHNLPAPPISQHVAPPSTYADQFQSERDLSSDKSPSSGNLFHNSKFGRSGFSDLPPVEEEAPAQFEPEHHSTGCHHEDDTYRDSAFVSESPVPPQGAFADIHEHARDNGVHLRDSSPAVVSQRPISTTDAAIASLVWPTVDEESETVDLHKPQRRKIETPIKEHHEEKSRERHGSPFPNEQATEFFRPRKDDNISIKHHHEEPSSLDLLPSQRAKGETHTDLHRTSTIHGSASERPHRFHEEKSIRDISPPLQAREENQTSLHRTQTFHRSSEENPSLSHKDQDIRRSLTPPNRIDETPSPSILRKEAASTRKPESLVRQRLQTFESSEVIQSPKFRDESSSVRQQVQRMESPELPRTPSRPKEESYSTLSQSQIPRAERSQAVSGNTIAAGVAFAGAATLGFAAARQLSAEKRPSSAASYKSISNINRLRTPVPRPDSSNSNRSGTPPLRRSDRKISGDLRSLSQQSQLDLAKEAELAASSTSVNFAIANSTTLTNPTANEGRVRAKDMADVYDGFGEGRVGSPRSPTRPHSMRRRQSMQVLDLESKVEQLAAENRMLAEAKVQAERILHASTANSSSLVEKEAEIDALKRTFSWLQNEVSRLTEVNNGLTSANITLGNQQNERYGILETQHAQNLRELQEAREAHTSLSSGMQGIVLAQVQTAVQEKDQEIAQLRAELENTKEKIRQMQQEILLSKSSDIDFLTIRDEDYFDNACQQLCQHVQQWVLRFSKFSDMRACRLTSEINNNKTIDRLDNAILDGSDVDSYLSDRVKRRDVFMSMTMTMVWEFIFTRYLFGMDRDQRQKLKSLEKLLSEVGPAAAVHQWRATTLTLLSKREQFIQQRQQDTQAVVHAVLETLSEILPPPSHLEAQIEDQLKRVMKAAVDLSIEMRTQRAEYMMLPPLQPEYDANGDLASKVSFNAALMNERSGDTVSNEELEASRAVVRVVLFPLVVKKGDDRGEGDEEIVVCPAQVLVAKQKKSVRMMSPHGNISRASMQSSMPADYGEDKDDENVV